MKSVLHLVTSKQDFQKKISNKHLMSKCVKMNLNTLVNSSRVTFSSPLYNGKGFH